MIKEHKLLAEKEISITKKTWKTFSLTSNQMNTYSNNDLLCVI